MAITGQLEKPLKTSQPVDRTYFCLKSEKLLQELKTECDSNSHPYNSDKGKISTQVHIH